MGCGSSSAGSSGILALIEAGDDAGVRRVLRDNPGSATGGKSKDGGSVLHHAACREPKEGTNCLEALISSPGVDLNAKNTAGLTPLMSAVDCGRASAVRLLLRSGARASVHGPGGETAIHMAAASQGKSPCIQAALDCGVDAKLRNGSGEPLLLVAARAGALESVELLLGGKAAVNETASGGACQGWTALHAAAANGHKGVCQALLKQGQADVILKTPDGQLARQLAAAAGHKALAELIGGAVNEEDVNAGKVIMLSGDGDAPEGDQEGLNPCSDETRNRVQGLMDETWKDITTRDRGYAALQEFEVVQVLQNASKALQDVYRKRQEEITNHYVEKLQDVKTVIESWESSLQLARDPKVNEFFLFHGTNPSAAQSICESGFNVDLSGSNKGALYGPGVYLAESSAKADEYAGDDKEGIYKGLFAMLLCRASLGNPIVNEEVQPDKEEITRLLQAHDKHSVLGDREKARGTYREFIVRDGRGVYPAYVIIYRRKKQKK
jgi:hypothetical protein